MLVRLATAAILALTACQLVPPAGVATPTPSPAGSVDAGGSFRIALASEPTTLDPWNANDPNTLLVTEQIFETLVDYEPGGFKIVPKLAETWSVSADGRTWTFALRRGVKFHDGTDLDAAAVVLNLDRARQTAHPLRGASSSDRYRAYAALFDGFDDASAIVRVEASDSRTVVVTTRVPFGPLLADLAMPSFAIVSPRSMQNDPAGWSTSATRGAAGTGPFVVRPGAWQPGQQIALDRNGSYWLKDQRGVALPYLDRVIFRVIKDETARVAELRSGGLDALRDLVPASLPTVRGDPNLQLLTRPPFSTSYLGISSTATPFDKVEVRRAVAMALDKGLLAAALYSGAGRPASQLILPGMLGYDDSVVEFYRYDASAAKRLLTEAGLGTGFATELWYPPPSRAQLPDPRRVAEALAADLARIGIVATLRTEDVAVFGADAHADRMPLWLGEVSGDSADPDSFFSDGGAWAGDVVRELLRRAKAEADASKRTELYKQVSKLIQQDAARIPLVHASTLSATTKKVRGLTLQPTGVEPFSTVWLGK